IAVWTVGECAAASKTCGHQGGVGLGVDQMTGRGHLRARLPARQVAAWIGGGCIELHNREREFLKAAHDDVMITAHPGRIAIRSATYHPGAARRLPRAEPGVRVPG